MSRAQVVDAFSSGFAPVPDGGCEELPLPAAGWGQGGGGGGNGNGGGL